MENKNKENGSGQQTINIQVTLPDNIVKSRPLIPVLFALTIIFFFFNFFTVSCGGQKVGSVTGINLVTGTELKSREVISTGETKSGNIPSNTWAIMAFGASVIGLAAFFIFKKKESFIGTASGVIGFCSLLILQFAIKSTIEKETKEAFQIDFHFAYWNALISIGIAGLINFLRIYKSHNKGFNVVHSSNQSQSNQNNESPTPPSIDIKIPIGLLFAVLGTILTIFGIFTMNDPELYARSLGRNINLWTGLSMLIFGSFMLELFYDDWRKRSRK